MKLNIRLANAERNVLDVNDLKGDQSGSHRSAAVQDVESDIQVRGKSVE